MLKRKQDEIVDANKKQKIEQVEEIDEMDILLKTLGLPCSFNSTKYKQVPGNESNHAVHIQKERKAGQYIHHMRKPEENKN